MSAFGYDLYEKLMKLAAESEAFYFSDATLNGVQYRIFNYRIASFTEFSKPGALECRGHMFQVKDGEFVKLVCVPMEKFFNLNENPFTQGWEPELSHGNHRATSKMDGSLISTFWQDDKNETGVAGMYFKTKGSLTSIQAKDALKWSFRDATFHDALRMITQFGATVNLEWTSPENRIVVGYQTQALTILNVRDTRSGQYMSKQEIFRRFPLLERYWVKDFRDQYGWAFDVSKIRSLVGIEGFVVELPDGRKAKVKTDWYVALHKTKESVDSDRKLFETIIRGAHDDLKAMFSDNPYVLGKISKMEEFVVPKFRATITVVEMFYNDNKHLDRKSYAILAKGTITTLMGLAMNRYLGREVEYEEWAIKYPENYLEGFTYEAPSQEV